MYLLRKHNPFKLRPTTTNIHNNNTNSMINTETMTKTNNTTTIKLSMISQHTTSINSMISSMIIKITKNTRKIHLWQSSHVHPSQSSHVLLKLFHNAHYLTLMKKKSSKLSQKQCKQSSSNNQLLKRSHFRLLMKTQMKQHHSRPRRNLLPLCC